MQKQAKKNEQFTRILQWDARLKSADIDISTTTARRVAKTPNPGNWNYACVLSKLPAKKSECIIKVKSRNYGMLLGICEWQRAAQHNFLDWCWGFGAHGHYVVESDGGIFFSKGTTSNSQAKNIGFHYRAGDVVIVRFNQTDGVLDLIGKQKTLKIQTQIGKLYRFCVYMFNQGDAVELLDIH